MQVTQVPKISKNHSTYFHIIQVFQDIPSIPLQVYLQVSELLPLVRPTSALQPRTLAMQQRAAPRSTAQQRAARRGSSRFIEVHRGSSVCSQGAVAKFRLAIAGPRWHHLRQRLVEIVPHTFARKTKNNQKDAILNEVLMTYFN